MHYADYKIIKLQLLSDVHIKSFEHLDPNESIHRTKTECLQKLQDT